MVKQILLLTIAFGSVSPAIASADKCADAVKPKLETLDDGTRVLNTSKEAKVVYRLSGNPNGDVVVIFLNGIDRDMSQWRSTLYWLTMMTSKQQFVQVDLLRQGQTSRMNPRDAAELNFRDQTDALDELIHANGWDKKHVVLVGHSYGGGIAPRYAADHPGVVQDVVGIAHFADNIEIHQPGLGPTMAGAKMMTDATNTQQIYELGVSTMSEATMVATWPIHSTINYSPALLGDVLALTRGIRDLRMIDAVRNLGTTRFHQIQSAFDEMIPATAYAGVWAQVPPANRGTRTYLPTVHNSVQTMPFAVALLLSQIVPSSPRAK